MKITRKIAILIACVALMAGWMSAQEDFENWMHKGPQKEYPTGIRSEEWYAKSGSDKPKTIVVAVLDTGIDIEHPDLSPNIWVNQDEIPGNQKDDDGNGYVDDVHGWNFIGGADGKSVLTETFEVTRVYAQEKSKWAQVNPESLKGKRKKEYEAFLEIKETIETKLARAESQLNDVLGMKATVMKCLMAAKEALGSDSLDLEKLENSENEDVLMGAKIIRSIMADGIPVKNMDWLLEQAEMQFDMQLEDSEKDLNYHFNTAFDSRKIVGDTYYDFNDRHYGNADVGGEFSFHGTHVAGIIGALRNNGEGINGVADHVAIMPVKMLPDGDERDKDVANSIIYAVDNGASIINMSFGKGYSPEKHLVDAAMKYAAKHDVLLVHGSGNEGKNMDDGPNFPNDTYLKKPFLGRKGPPNMIAVGALSPEGGEYSIAEFSNYGKEEVDVFAPGVYIYSTTPNNQYEYASGTSMAAPVVSGIAALIRSQYPDLSAVQVKEIIMKSVRPLPDKILAPGTFLPVKGSDLCASGGMVDVVAAMKMASQTKGKAKVKNRKPEAEYVPRSEKV